MAIINYPPATGGGSGTVTSVSGTGTVNGISLSGTVTTTGSLSLGGTLGGIGNSQLTNSSITINGTPISLGGSVTTPSGTITSVAALTLGTTGTDLSSTVATGTTTPVITLNVPTASASNRGVLSSTDWSTFNGKQDALVSGTSIKTVNSTSLLGSGNVAVQETLVSATNIKTINGSSILGSGDLSVSASAGGSTTQIQYNNAGSLAGAANLQYDGTNLGVGMTPDGSSWVQVAAGTASKAPFELTSSAGTLMGTPDDGSIEYDGTVFYMTPNTNNRGVTVNEHFVARTGTKTMTSNTTLQAIFSGGSGGLTNGALTVNAATTYYFECSLNVSTMSATSGNFGFSIVGAGTATFTSAAWHAFGLDATTQTTAAAAGTSFSASQAATGNIITAATGTAASVLIKGIFRINAGGTIIPSIQLTTANAAVIGRNSWFKCYAVGSNTVVSVGNWS